MGNKCCSRRHDPDRPLVYPASKKNEAGFTTCPSLENRYTGEPNNRVVSRRPADIVRTRNPGTCISNGGRRVVKALCAYTARAESDISFRKGDRMEVLSDAEPDWWRVLHLTTRREGLVPANFVAEESSVECEENMDIKHLVQLIREKNRQIRHNRRKRMDRRNRWRKLKIF